MTPSEGMQWCSQNDIVLDTEWLAYESESDRVFGLPKRSGVRSSLSLQIAQAIRLPALLWIEHPSPWSSSEQLPLFNLVRKALGDERDLDETPAHLFEDEDREALSAFLAMVMYFYWSAELLERKGERRWAFNDDQFLFFRSNDAESYDEALAIVRKYELKEWV